MHPSRRAYPHLYDPRTLSYHSRCTYHCAHSPQNAVAIDLLMADLTNHVNNLRVAIQENQRLTENLQSHVDSLTIRIFNALANHGLPPPTPAVDNNGETHQPPPHLIPDGVTICFEGVEGIWSPVDPALNYHQLYRIIDTLPSNNNPVDVTPTANIPLTANVTAFEFDTTDEMYKFLQAWADRPDNLAAMVATVHGSST